MDVDNENILCIDLSEAYLLSKGGYFVLGIDEGAFLMEYTDFSDSESTDNGIVFYADKRCGDLFRSSIAVSLSSHGGRLRLTFSSMHDGSFKISPLNGYSPSLKRDGKNSGVILSFTREKSFCVTLDGDCRYDNGVITVRQGISHMTVGLEGGNLSLSKKREVTGFLYTANYCKKILTCGGIDIFGRLSPYMLLPSLLSERRLDKGRTDILINDLKYLSDTDRIKAATALYAYFRAFGEETPYAVMSERTHSLPLSADALL